MEERKCAFAVVVNTGEQPQSSIHMVAFPEGEDSIATTLKVEGRIIDQMTMATSIVESICETLNEKSNVMHQMMFYNRVCEAMHEKMPGLMKLHDKLPEVLSMLGLNNDDDEGDED